MVDVNISKSRDMGVAREKTRHPWVEDFIGTMKVFVHNRLAFGGALVVLTYFFIAVLDYAYPQWLGVAHIDSMIGFLGGAPLTSKLPTPPTLAGGWWYWLGTTESRIPLFPSILAALKFDMTYSVIIVIVGMLSGIAIGTVSGYFGGLVDEVLMRVTDIFLSLPSLVLAIAVVYILGETITNVVLALMIIWWPIYARLTRGVTLSVKNQKFIEAAVASGSPKFRNILIHVIPNVLSPAFVQISLDLGSVMLIFAGLDFIGFNKGSPYLSELGNLINKGQPFLIGGQWWPVFFPGLFILIFTVAANVMGDGLRDVLDPKLRR